MPDIYMDVDTALTEVPVNIFPLTDDTDFKSIEGAVAYNAAGMTLFWHFVTSAGAYTLTAVTPTTAGNYDWTDQGAAGIYTIEIPASGGASINNDTEGYGWFTGVATGVLPWRGPVIGFRAAAINDSMCDTNTTGILAPTTAGRTLDVSAGGEAGVDWANVGTPGSTVGLSATTVATVTTTTTATNVTTVNGLAANVITAAAIADGAIDAATFAAGAITATVIADGAIDAATLAADTITAAKVAADVTTEIWAGSTAPTSATIAAAVWDLDATTHQTQGTFGQAIGDPTSNATTLYQSIVTDAAGTHVAADIIAIKAETASILTDTAEIGAAGAGLTNINLPDQTMNITGNITGNLSGSVGSVTGLTNATIADAVLDEDMTAHQTQGSLGQAIGDPAADTGTIYKAVVTDATGVTIGADIVAMKVDTAAILVDTGTTLDGRIPAALVSGRMDSDIGAVRADTTAATNLEAMFDGTGYAGGTTKLGVNAIQISSDTTSADNLQLFFDGTGYAATNSTVGTVTTLTGKTGFSLDTAEHTNIADATLKRDMSVVTGEANRSPLNALRFLRNKWSLSGTALTVTKENDTDTAWTAVVTATPGADPITGNDPA